MWFHHLTFPVTVNNVDSVCVAEMSEVDNEKDIARQMVVSVQQQQRFQKINSDYTDSRG